MKIKTQFSRNSLTYNVFNIIQQQVIKKLLQEMPDKPQSILDLGCGTGGVYKAINWQLDHFVGVDFSEQMLCQHPRAANLECRLGDFNDDNLFDQLSQETFGRIVSASSLQWANDLETTFKNMQELNTPVSLAIFTADTFKTLFTTANIPPLLRTVDEVSVLAKKYFSASYETVNYTLAFASTQEMLRYIKKSGVSSSRNMLGYKSTKQLIHNYPLQYLEFEVLYIIE